MPPSNPADVLAECHAAGASGIFMVSMHAAQRAQQRNIDRDDVRHALQGSTAAQLQGNGRWTITGGLDLGGAPVTLVVSVFRGLVIVTLF